MQLLNVTCGREDLPTSAESAGGEGYLLLVKCEACMDSPSDCPQWTGPSKKVEPTAEATIALSHIEVSHIPNASLIN